MVKALPCLYCQGLLTGYTIINIKRLKYHKSIKCPHCGAFNIITSEDHNRMIDTNIRRCYPHETSINEEYWQTCQHKRHRLRAMLQ